MTDHDETCCMNGAWPWPGGGSHPDCPGWRALNAARASRVDRLDETDPYEDAVTVDTRGRT